jgi:hypothetical protein
MVRKSMIRDRNAVAIVVTPGGSGVIARLAERCPVWAIRTPEIEQVAHDARAGGADITLFTPDDDPEESLLSVIDEVELHRGVHSRSVPVGLVEVVGSPLSEPVRQRFQELGFSDFELTLDGFVAHRLPAR